MSFLSNVISTIAKPVATVASFVPTPAGQAVAFVARAKVASDQRREAKEQQEIYNRSISQMDPLIHGIERDVRLSQIGNRGINTGGFGSQFGTFISDVGRNIATPFANLASTLAPFFGRSIPDQPAVTTTRNTGGQETQGSGTVEGFIGGGGLGSALSTAGRFLKTPTGQIGTGLGLGFLGSMMDGSGRTMRITRKMKSQYRTVLNLANGNISVASDILGVPEDFFISVMLKRFRNDGPVVTKAALRKTKSTIRKLHNMQDVLKSMTPTSTGRRRAPMKRATTTLISNK